MFQLNNDKEIESNEENIDKNPKKRLKGITKIIIFLITFTLICAIVTAGLIIMHNRKNLEQEENVNNKQEEKKEIFEVEDDGFGIKSLTERYNNNALKIERNEDKIGTRVPTHEYDNNTSKIRIEYFSIDGLKNEEIEKQINKELKDKAYELYKDEELNDSNIDSINIYSHEQANFGNVLSVEITKSINYKEVNGEYKYDYSTEYLNFDLTTGNKISFKELFTNKTSIKNVLIPAINKTIRNKYMNENRTGDGFHIDFATMDLSSVEEETYVILNKIMKNIDNIKFGFSCRNIFLNLDDENIVIDMSETYQNIAIYKRFLTKDSIFDDKYGDTTKSGFVFTYIMEDYNGQEKTYLMLKDITNNLRIEAKVSCSNDIYNEKEGKEIYNEYIEILSEQIEKLKKEANNETDNQILYVAEYSIYGSEDKSLTNRGIKNLIVHTGGGAQIYRMNKQYYDEYFYEKMAEEKRNLMGVSDVYFYYVEENNNVSVEEVRQEHQQFDLYTNKTANELIGIQEIENVLKPLENQKQDIINNIPDSSPFHLHCWKYVEDMKKLFNLSNEDEDVKELERKIQELINEIEELIKEKEREKEQERQEQENKTETSNDNQNNNLQADIVKPNSYGEPLPAEGIAFIKEGYLYYSYNESEEAEKIQEVSNIKELYTYNIGTGINKVPFVLTEDGDVYRLNSAKQLLVYKELSNYKIDKIVSHEGEIYDVFTLLLKDGTTKVVEVKE